MVGVSSARAGVYCVLAMLKAGGGYVPVDPEWPLARKQHILRATGARAAVHGVVCGSFVDMKECLLCRSFCLIYINFFFFTNNKIYHRILQLTAVPNMVFRRSEEQTKTMAKMFGKNYRPIASLITKAIPGKADLGDEVQGIKTSVELGSLVLSFLSI